MISPANMPAKKSKLTWTPPANKRPEVTVAPTPKASIDNAARRRACRNGWTA